MSKSYSPVNNNSLLKKPLQIKDSRKNKIFRNLCQQQQTRKFCMMINCGIRKKSFAGAMSTHLFAHSDLLSNIVDFYSQLVSHDNLSRARYHLHKRIVTCTPNQLKASHSRRGNPHIYILYRRQICAFKVQYLFVLRSRTCSCLVSNRIIRHRRDKATAI